MDLTPADRDLVREALAAARRRAVAGLLRVVSRAPARGGRS